MKGKSQVVYRIRTQAFASGYDIKKQNDTIRYLKKYCQAYFESDIGKNRYFDIDRLVKGAESGCYFAIQNLDNHFSLLCHSLRKYPNDVEAEKSMVEFGIPTPSSFNANVYLSYLCSLIEEFFRATYIALLKLITKEEKVYMNKWIKFLSVDME